LRASHSKWTLPICFTNEIIPYNYTYFNMVYYIYPLNLTLEITCFFGGFEKAAKKVRWIDLL